MNKKVSNLALKIEAVVLLFIIMGGIWYVTRDKGKVTNEVAEKSLIKSNPLLISNLRSRNYGGSEIVRVRKVKQGPKFESYVVSFMSDGLKEYALLDIPMGKKPENGWPVVIVNHGHINPKIYSTENSYVNTATYFANSGFLVLKPDYRGHDKSEGVAETLTARIDYSIDVLNLLADLKTIPEADTQNVFMYGHSMGGEVTLRTLEITGTVKAATLWAPAVTEFPQGILYFIEKDTPNAAAAIAEEVEKTFDKDDYGLLGTLENVNLVKVPINIQHSVTDETVPFLWGKNLYDKMRTSGVRVNFYAYEGDDHNLSHNWSVALARDVQLFKQMIEEANQ